MSINFSIPDFFMHYRLNVLLNHYVTSYPKWFYDDIKITSNFGCIPNCVWNGGKYQDAIYNFNDIKFVLNSFHEMYMPLRFTFTNTLIDEEHLNDKLCNYILKEADNGINEVIVASDLLENYIRKNYPRYKINSSAVKCITDKDKLEAELNKDYKLVCLDFDLNNKFDMLKTLTHKEKCEFVINSTCQPNCARKEAHYRSVSEEHISLYEFSSDPANEGKLYGVIPYPCKQLKTSSIDCRGYSNYITVENLYSKYVPMGFNNFKFDGRNKSDIDVLEGYVYYLVKPEFRDNVRFYMLNEITKNHFYFFE